jgi:predicted Zn-dependent peptidase
MNYITLLIKGGVMKSIHHSILFIFLILFAMLSCTQKDFTKFTVPVEYHQLDNGLKIILSQDKTTPIVTVAVYYNIGFRIEPKDRTGFAHLFEHMMFQGSQNLDKMEFIKLVQSNGGVLNGSTRFDFTNYFEIVPAHKLETMLWAEADRMRGLAITQENLTNQQGVVTNEVKVNVLNQPYGGFPWLDMPQYANENWYNAHNFYGELSDIEEATLEDVQNFFNTYYSPNNAALVIVGDFESAEALNLVNKYFGDIPAADMPQLPDISEARQEKEKRFLKEDKLATKPALAFSYHVPHRLTPEYFAMGLIDQILLQGEDSWLYQSLVQVKGFTDDVSGGINALLGNMYNYNGPMLWMASFKHDQEITPDSILHKIDEQVERMRNNPIDKATLDRALIKIRSNLYSVISQSWGFGRADVLACFALFDDNPNFINQLEEEFRKVTPELLQQTAQEYLRPTNRTVLILTSESAKM